MFLTCLVISEDHVIKRSWEFMGRVKVSPDPARFGDHKLCSSRDIK